MSKINDLILFVNYINVEDLYCDNNFRIYLNFFSSALTIDDTIDQNSPITFSSGFIKKLNYIIEMLNRDILDDDERIRVQNRIEMIKHLFDTYHDTSVVISPDQNDDSRGSESKKRKLDHSLEENTPSKSANNESLLYMDIMLKLRQIVEIQPILNDFYNGLLNNNLDPVDWKLALAFFEKDLDIVNILPNPLLAMFSLGVTHNITFIIKDTFQIYYRAYQGKLVNDLNILKSFLDIAIKNDWTDYLTELANEKIFDQPIFNWYLSQTSENLLHSMYYYLITHDYQNKAATRNLLGLIYREKLFLNSIIQTLIDKNYKRSLGNLIKIIENSSDGNKSIKFLDYILNLNKGSRQYYSEMVMALIEHSKIETKHWLFNQSQHVQTLISSSLTPENVCYFILKYYEDGAKYLDQYSYIDRYQQKNRTLLQWYLLKFENLTQFVTIFNMLKELDLTKEAKAAYMTIMIIYLKELNLTPNDCRMATIYINSINESGHPASVLCKKQYKSIKDWQTMNPDATVEEQKRMIKHILGISPNANALPVIAVNSVPDASFSNTLNSSSPIILTSSNENTDQSSNPVSRPIQIVATEPFDDLPEVLIDNLRKSGEKFLGIIPIADTYADATSINTKENKFQSAQSNSLIGNNKQ